MKRYVFYCAAILLIFASCKDKKQPSNLNASNLASTFITLNADSAYNLKTPKGAIIRVPKGAFDLVTGNKIRLEIKEAYSMQDILLAGLSTKSDGRLLSSGGMIYFNATSDGNRVRIIKPINIAIPTTNYNDSMKLFKGDVKDDSTINWTDPQPLDSTAKQKYLSMGEKLFKANCASCHKPTEDFTGPALAGCRFREPNIEWAYKFTNNSNELIETDPYAKALFKKYGSRMTQFHLTAEEIKAILDYCDSISDKNPVIAGTSDSQIKIDTCYTTDTFYYPKPDTSITVIDSDTTSNLSYDTSFLNKPASAQSMEILRRGFTDPNYTSGMYDFDINTNGWFNVDYFVEGYQGSTLVSINVELQTQYQDEMHVYLFCPDKKMLSVAYEHNGNKYWFDKIDNKIPLFLNDKAVILAFGSHTDKMLYGTVAFNIKTDQTIQLQLKETTETELKSFVIKNNIDGITIDTNKKDSFTTVKRPCNGDYPEIYDSTRTK